MSDAGLFRLVFLVLFHRSGWTQEELAKKEGKSQRWVSYRLVFGRFLLFSTTGANASKLPFNVTERRFRLYYERTTGMNERQRFAEVADHVLPNGGAFGVGFECEKWANVGFLLRKMRQIWRVL